MNDYLKNVPTKLTSIPILSEAQLNGQSTLKVPSVKLQRWAIVRIISTTTSVTTPISVSAASMNPIAQPFDPRNLRINWNWRRQWDSPHYEAISWRQARIYVRLQKGFKPCRKYKTRSRLFWHSKETSRTVKNDFYTIGQKSLTYSQATYVL